MIGKCAKETIDTDKKRKSSGELRENRENREEKEMNSNEKLDLLIF